MAKQPGGLPGSEATCFAARGTQTPGTRVALSGAPHGGAANATGVPKVRHGVPALGTVALVAREVPREDVVDALLSPKESQAF